MAINEIQKLLRLARHSQEEFITQGSLLNQTRLSRFIIIALLLHVSVVILQSLVILKPKDPLTLPPIKVKYVDIQKSEPIEQEKRLLNASKPIKTKNQENTPYKQKKYHKTETVTPKTSAKRNISKRTQAQLKFKIPASSKERFVEKHSSVPPSAKKNVAPEIAKNKDTLSHEKNLRKGGTLSMLDSFDAKKYAPQKQQTLTQDSLYDEKPISLDTKETKYVSYFNRIKHQIERSWRYPSEAAKRGMSGQLKLKFIISRDGNLLGISLVDNSGFEILDIAAVKAVKEAAPYYPFPLTISKKKLSILATFVYSPNLN